MRIFISFASEDRQFAEQIHFALVGAGYETFYDKESLPPAGDFNVRIRAGVERSDFLVFLISPSSIEPGNYALTELRYARMKWSHPNGRVLPVMLHKVAWDQVPSYLSAVTVLEPEGNLPAEVTLAISSLVSAVKPRRTKARKTTVVVGSSLALSLVTLIALNTRELRYALGLERRPTSARISLGEIRSVDIRSMLPPEMSERERLAATAVLFVSSVSLLNESEPALTAFVDDSTATIEIADRRWNFRWHWFANPNPNPYSPWLGIESDATRFPVAPGPGVSKEILYEPTTPVKWDEFIKIFLNPPATRIVVKVTVRLGQTSLVKSCVTDLTRWSQEARTFKQKNGRTPSRMTMSCIH
jgi:hypothetical protein